MNETIGNFIEIYAWTVAAVIMMFIVAIANFYQKKFNIKTFYYFYFIPVFVLLIAAIHIFSYKTLLAELIEFFGSVGSFMASFFLYRKMIGVK